MSEPVVARTQPMEVAVEEGKSYLWCACGRSRNQPFCDGSHKGTGLAPVRYVADASQSVWFCCCKQTSNKPFCDGTHNTL